jgi:hypothetical protein
MVPAASGQESSVDPAEPIPIPNPLVDLLTPRTRAQIVDVMLNEPTRQWTASEVCADAGMDPSTFNAHASALIDAGVIEEAGMKGNAQTYTPVLENPVVGALQMVRSLYRDGVTFDYVEDEVIISGPEQVNDVLDVCPRCGVETEEIGYGPKGFVCGECF